MLFEYLNSELVNRQNMYNNWIKMWNYWQYPLYYDIMTREDFEFDTNK